MADLDRLRAALADLYGVDCELGRTTLGRTFAADTRDGEPVVLHVVDRRFTQRMSEPEQFIRELERSRTLQHEALVPLAGAGITPDDTLYFALRQPIGESARERLARRGPLPVVEVAATGARLADALAILHAGGMLHGGVTPDCVHFAADKAYLGSVGVHGALLAAGLDRSAVAAALAGPEYMSPEQHAGGAMDPRSDTYTLGATLYELITGKRPLGGRATRAVMATVLADEQGANGAAATNGAAGTIDPQLSEHIVEAVLRAIEQSPDDRWAAAADFAAALGKRPGSTAARNGHDDTQAARPLAAMADLLKLGATRLRRGRR